MDNRPSNVIRRRLRELRGTRRLTRGQLSERLEAIGYPIEALTLARIEGGRTKRLSVDDVFALAYALNVSPLFLALPYGGETRDYEGQTVWLSNETVEVATQVQPISPDQLRDWLRGAEPLPGQNRADFYRELPPDELSRVMRAAHQVEVGRPSPPGAVALRNALIADGEAVPVPTVPAPELTDAVAAVADLTDAEVLAELNLGLPRDLQATDQELAEWLERTPREQREREIERLRGQLVQRWFEGERNRHETRKSLNRDEGFATRREVQQ